MSPNAIARRDQVIELVFRSTGVFQLTTASVKLAKVALKNQSFRFDEKWPRARGSDTFLFPRLATHTECDLGESRRAGIRHCRKTPRKFVVKLARVRKKRGFTRLTTSYSPTYSSVCLPSSLVPLFPFFISASASRDAALYVTRGRTIRHSGA